MLVWTRLGAATVTMAVCWLEISRIAAAQSCGDTVARSNVVGCAVRASLTLARARSEQEAQQGRYMAVNPLLPENPQLSLSAARRAGEGKRGGNWYASLSQELEVAGQRSARRAREQANLSAQQSAVVATERDVAALALRSYFQALAARDELSVAARLEDIFAHSSAAAQAGATQGLVSGVDAEVAELTTLKLSEQRIQAERQARSTLAALATLLGRDPARPQLSLEGELTPLSQVAALSLEQLYRSVNNRAELARARHLQRARHSAQAALERERVPNVTLSLLAQHDGFGEQVLGAGIRVPIPLPYPLGRTLHGELTENAALSREAEIELERTQRVVQLELVEAWHAHRAAVSQVELYTQPRVARAERSLESLGQALHAGRVPISTAVVAQQTLVEFLRAHIRARLQLCLASVELARSAGLPLQGAKL